MAVVIVRQEGSDAGHPFKKTYPYPERERSARREQPKAAGRNYAEEKQTVKKTGDAERTSVASSVLDELSKELDRITVDVGRTIGELFKTVSLAAAKLPPMRLHSDLLDVIVDDDSITVHIDGLFEGKKSDKEPDDVPDLDDLWPCSFHCVCGDRGYDDDDWDFEGYDCEEERLYDGD